MSVRNVNREIRKAVELDNCVGPVVTEAEAQKIVDTAEKGKLGQPTPVTVGEAKAIADLFDRSPVAQPPAPGSLMTMACPENGSDPRMDPGASETFNAFFVRNALPYGENLPEVKGRIERALEGVDLGAALACEPDVSKMHHVFLRDARPVDGDRRDAYLDADKGEIYLKVTGAGMAGPHTVGPFWYGPIALPEENPLAVRPEKADAMRRIFNDVSARGLVEWKSPDMALPQDLPTVRVPLMKERHPDGFTYTAIVPGGRNPFMPQEVPGVDPNSANRFWVERSGGIAGITEIAGPFSLEEDKQVSARKLQHLAFTLGLLKARGDLNDFKPLAEVLPAGQKVFEVPLTDNRYPDALNYSALLVLPKDGDPEGAPRFYLHRSGGIAGFNDAVGPFDIETPYYTMAVGEAPSADQRPDFTDVLGG